MRDGDSWPSVKMIFSATNPIVNTVYETKREVEKCQEFTKILRSGSNKEDTRAYSKKNSYFYYFQR